MPVIHFNKFRKIKLLKTNQMKGSWTAVFSKKLFNSKLIIRCGYEWLKTLEKTKKSLKKKVAYFLEKSAYKNADKLIFTSKEGADFVIKKFSISPEKIEIISNYIDTKLFRPLPIEKKGNRIVFVGRLEKEKNLSNLIISLEGIEAELVLIGEGPMRAELEKLSREKKVITIFKGNLKQKDLPEELNKSSIFILPSLFEGNPKALLEAMSCGLACIGTNVDGISGIIDNGNSGILSFSDSDSLKKAIIVLLENKELRDKLGINARKAIERNNDFDVLFGKELALYLNILS
jgi:glycosyltransferase involved in cell wall biosynthesis